MSDANNRLNELLISQIEKFDGALDKAVDFAAEQTPELIQQLLLWHMTLSLVMFSLAIAAAIILVLGLRKFWVWLGKEQEAHPNEDVTGGYALMVGVGVIVGVMCLGGIIENLDWLKILIAPKLYLLEYAAELVK